MKNLLRLAALLALLLTTAAFQDCRRHDERPTFRDSECKRQNAKVRDRLCYD